MKWPWSKKNSGEQSPEHGIEVTAALGLMARGAVTIDVRSAREYERGHMPGARLVDPRQLAENPVDAIWAQDPFAETDKPLIVVSTSGARAGAAVAVLRQQGYEAYLLTGGLSAWLQDGQVLVPGKQR